MTIELVLQPIETKKFLDLYPFQLFQVSDNFHIYCKVNERYARIISQEISYGRQFTPDEFVILLAPETVEEK